VETIVAIAGESSALVATLRLAGWRVRVRLPEEPLDELAVHGPDAIVFDVPRGALGRTLELVRAGPGLESTPTLALIDLEEVREVPRIKGLNDFCVRPGHKDELSTRLRRLVVKKTSGSAGNELRCGGLVIDQKGFMATLDGRPMDLAYQEFLLLRFLVGNPDHAFSREQLLARVWGWDYFGGSRTVDIHVRRLRAKLGHPYATWLHTIRHVGYRWSPGAPAETEPRPR
jgi:DNA-binding response OmpR family regulator